MEGLLIKGVEGVWDLWAGQLADGAEGTRFLEYLERRGQSERQTPSSESSAKSTGPEGVHRGTTEGLHHHTALSSFLNQVSHLV